MPSPETAPPPEKRARIVLHACDKCKAGKRKCDGKQPCSYCVNGKKTCTYNIIDKRRKRTSESPAPNPTAALPPLPFLSPPAISSGSPSFDPAPIPSSSSWRPPSASLAGTDGASPSAAHDDATLLLLAKAMAHEQMSPDGDIEGTGAKGKRSEEAGPTSFIERLHHHLKVTFALRSFPRGNGSDSEDVTESEFDSSTFFLPSREEAQKYVRCYFEQAAATYRYLDRRDTENLLGKFYDGDAATIASSDSVCLLLLTMAVGCLWTPSWTQADAASPPADPATATPRAVGLYLAAKRRLAKSSLFPPRLVTMQSYLLMVQLQLGLTKYQTAWMTFGSAARLAQLLGLHRASPESTNRDTDELRRRCFWCAFQMDRQLALVLGFPFIFDEADITQPYFTVPDLNQVDEGGVGDPRTLIGSLASIKLSRIIGHAIRRLHSPRDMPAAERDLVVRELDWELAQWKKDTPAFFHSSPAGDDNLLFAQIAPFYRRQQRGIRCTYHFIRLFIYRAYLLSSFLDHLPGAARLVVEDSDVIPQEVRACVEAAISIAEIASSMQSTLAGGMFWNTSYYTFASLTVLCVYTMVYPNAPDRFMIEGLMDGAMRGHEHLAGSTSVERQQILEESRRMAGVIKDRSGPQPFQPYFSALPHSLSNLDNGPVASSSDLFAPGSANWEAIWLDMQGLVQVGFDSQTAGYDSNLEQWGIAPFGELPATDGAG